MLTLDPTPALSDFDRLVFDLVVPPEHYLRRVAAAVDFERLRPRLAEAYSLGMGRPGVNPVRMLKILFLRFQYRLSDRQVIERAQTDMAFRWFLDWPVNNSVPHPTGNTKFRNRIGVERFAQIFQEIVTQAREAGLVKDRLRLKDATHMIADVADVSALRLAAQVRDRVWNAAEPLFPDWVAQQRVQFETLRQTTAEFPDEERLAARIEFVRDMAAQLRERLAAGAIATEAALMRLQRALAIVDKLLADREPGAQDRLVSAVDPDARVGMHGGFFVGYLLDMAIDADSELITSINVLPGNGAEAADTVTLIEQEEAAQGNDVEGVSLDGAGYNGPLLRELTDPDGLNLDVTVPPPTPAPRTTFGPERFSLTVLDDGQREVTCPAGKTTRSRSRTRQDTGDRYQFKLSQCRDCPQRAQCLENPESSRGRAVIKNDYEVEYQKVEAKTKTPEYQQTRRTHPKIERKLGEVVRHHGGRRASYRGTAKVLMQAVLTGLVVNVKRMVKLLVPQKPLSPRTAETVRAELGWQG